MPNCSHNPMTPQATNHRRIAKNTLVLYLRTIVTLLVSLYTSRVVLGALGVEDYGIYSLVGGVVVLFTFINGALGGATQRFLCYEMESGDQHSLRQTFSIAMSSHLLVALLVLVLAESIGLWFLNYELNIPAERMAAANWVYQFSILSTCVGIITVPYYATIISHERMSFYAYLSIFESALKLGIALLVMLSKGDRLILYAALYSTISLLTLLVYKIYCNRHFLESRYRYLWDSARFKEFISFSGWSLLGSSANIAASQGINMLFNIFFGVVVNAAMGITMQVRGAVYSFISNFQLAFNPQLIKSYASGDHTYLRSLIHDTSRFSLYMYLTLALPVLACTEPLLTLWLKTVPPNTVEFTQLILLFLLFDVISNPLWITVQAIGKIRNYQLMMAGLIALNLPLSYVVFKLGANAEWALIIKVALNIVSYLARLIYLRHLMEFSLRSYAQQVVWRCLLVTSVATGLAYWLHTPLLCSTGLIPTCILLALLTATTAYLLGLKPSERRYITTYLQAKLNRNS